MNSHGSIEPDEQSEFDRSGPSEVGSTGDTVTRSLTRLQDGDESVRADALKQLRCVAEMDPDQVAGAVPLLAGCLSDASAATKVLTLEVICLLGKRAEAVLDRVAGLLADPDPVIRYHAARTASSLGGLGKALPVFVALLEQAEEDWLRTQNIHAILRYFGLESRAAVPVLLSNLQSPIWDITESAARTLQTIVGDQTVADIVDLYGNPNPKIRRNALNMMTTLWPDHASTVPSLLAGLQDPAPQVRAVAANALGTLGNQAPGILSALTAALRDRSRLVRIKAAGSLGRLDPRSMPAFFVLEDALNRGNRSLRIEATQALSQFIGPEGSDLVPTLIGCIQTHDKILAAFSAQALARIGAPAVAALLAVLEDEDDLTSHFWVLQSLEDIGRAAKDAVPHALRVLDHAPRYLLPLDDEAWSGELAAVPGSAITALSRLVGPEHAAAVPYLIRALAWDNDLIRAAAARGLGNIGPDAREAVPALLSAVHGRKEDVRQAVEEALFRIGPDLLNTLP